MKNSITLAALFHDIGKFYQRADPDSVKNSKILAQEIKNLEPILCPSNSFGRYTHKHVLYTAQFLENHKSVFETILKTELPANIGFMRLSAAHHNPMTDFERIITKADHLSSGIDRIKDPNAIKEGENESGNWENFKKVRLRSIFENLSNPVPAIFEYSYPISALYPDQTIFPTKTSLGEQVDYQQNWADFESEFKLIPNDSVNEFIETCLTLLEKHLSYIPSSTIHLPDVSLFDHLKSTAAFAQALFEFKMEGEKNEDEFLLVGGDLTGIQNFIYDIANSQAIKNLKGRSFYIHLLVEEILTKILTRLNFTKAQVIYSTGGGFYLLIANTEKNKLILEELRKETEERLLQKFSTNLYFSIAWVSFNNFQIINNQTNEIWKLLMELINEGKSRRYSYSIVDNYSYFFEKTGIGGLAPIDAITGEEIHSDEAPVKFDEKVISGFTNSLIDLGTVLRDADFWVTAKREEHYKPTKIKGFEGLWQDEIHYFPNKSKVNILHSDNLKIVSFNKFIFKDLIANFRGKRTSFSHDLIGGNSIPEKLDGSAATFEDIAGSSGFNKMAILRMDVDNLGRHLIRGFGETRKTFSRYSSISRQLDFFFKGYLNQFRNQDSKFKDKIIIVYSGGDDLFVAGAWQEVFLFAKLVNDKFKEFTCYNPYLTISAGIVLVSSKFPIRKSAGMAEEMQTQAKENLYAKREKNSISIFGVPLNWDFEYLIVIETLAILEKINSAMNSNNIVQRILHFRALKNHQEAHSLNPSWNWLLTYDFVRLRDRLKAENQETEKFLKEQIDILVNCIFSNTWKGKKVEGKNTFLDLLAVAARWSELNNKSNG